MQITENVNKLTPILNQFIQEIPKTKAFLYKQHEYIIAQQMIAGQTSSIKVSNIPPCYQLQELEKFFFTTNLIIDTTQLEYNYTDKNVIVLESQNSDFVKNAAVISDEYNEILIILFFEKTQHKIEFYKEMYKLLCVLQEQNVFHTYNLSFVPKVPQIQRANNADLLQYLLFLNNKLYYYNNPVQFNNQIHRLGLLIFLNPIFCDFQYNIQRISYMQKAFRQLYIVVCIKGIVQKGVGTEKVLEKCIFQDQLNLVYETGTVADKYLDSKTSFSCQLIDFYPKPEDKIPNISKNSLFSEYLKNLIKSTDYYYNKECNCHPLFIYKSNEFDITLRILEDAFETKILKQLLYIDQMLLDKNQISFYGIVQNCRFVQEIYLQEQYRNRATSVLDNKTNTEQIEQPEPEINTNEFYDEGPLGYAIIFLQNQNQITQPIYQNIQANKQITYFFAIKGLTKQTLVMFQTTNPYLKQINLIYDTENIFRILKESRSRPNDFRINVPIVNNNQMDIYLCGTNMELISFGCQFEQIEREFLQQREQDDIKQEMRKKAISAAKIRQSSQQTGEFEFIQLASIDASQL